MQHGRTAAQASGRARGGELATMARTRTMSVAAAGEGAKSARPTRPGLEPTGAAAIVSGGSEFGTTNFAAMAQANAALMDGLEAIQVTVYARGADRQFRPRRRDRRQGNRRGAQAALRAYSRYDIQAESCNEALAAVL